jgi:DNA-binding MarR family transcriptional regulator
MNDEADELQERDRVLKNLETLAESYQATTLPVLLDSLLTTDLTIQQLKVLAVLATTEDGATGRGLADSFDRLVAQGAAARTRDEKDGRVRRVHATPLGRALVRRLVSDVPELSSELLKRLPLDDLQALERGLLAVYAEVARKP